MSRKAGGGQMARGTGRGPGIADRLREKMRERGYWLESKDRPAAMRFAEEKGYDLLSVLKWLDGLQPSWDNLYRLAVDLKVTPAWLLFGEDGGRQLATSATSTSAPSRSSKRGRASKIIGPAALVGTFVAPRVAPPTRACGPPPK